MSISTCAEIKNENLSRELTDQLSKELNIEGVRLVITLDVKGQLNIGAPANVRITRPEEVLSKLTAQKVTGSCLVTGHLDNQAGIYSIGGWSIGFIED
ncbi:MAG: hypothetical protein V3V31_16305 [Methylococcales bacterium]